MRVFLTGASGFVGSAVVKELLSSGHQVVALARSDASAKALLDAGAEVHRGDLKNLESLKSGAAASDGVIHCAFIHDFNNFMDSCTTDRLAIEALGEALAGSNKPLIVTCGSAAVPPGMLATENTPADPAGLAAPRVPSEELALSLAARGIRSAVIRLPPTVHGEGDHGFVPALINIARGKGAAAYINDGANRWPAVHRSDAAQLYRLVLEKGEAGKRYHAIAEEGIPFKQFTELIGRKLNVPVVSKAFGEEAAAHFGFLGYFAATDNWVSSALTQEQLGWKPTGLSLMEDLDQPYYFEATKSTDFETA
eukprot:TRINITY_DN3281_c0_g1_i1.p1 TRINITY_DN3281_c0_g1~~TRINITY_DN3281_c0_g1_i1.p1  ORF type:complete len:309 (+),score=55.97 TRINITY_DN3281_c0_g1_i1:100-1026(+)